MNAWYVVLILGLVVFAVGQLWWTRQHGRNLDEHTERMREIYRTHGYGDNETAHGNRPRNRPRHARTRPVEPK